MAIISVRLSGSNAEFTINQRNPGEAAGITSTFGKDIGSSEHEYAAALNGVESLILSLYCAGIDVTTPKFCEALEATLEAIENNYG